MRRLLTLLAVPVLIAAAPAPKIVVANPEVRPTQGTLMTSAGYFTVTNAGTAPDTLTGAACACAASASLHKTETRGGVSRMAPAGPIALAPGASVTLKPGGLHLMLMGLKAPIKPGDTVRVTLTFAKAGKVEVPLKAAAMAGMDHSMMDHSKMDHGHMAH
jgi:copper(I)-binding protein